MRVAPPLPPISAVLTPKKQLKVRHVDKLELRKINRSSNKISNESQSSKEIVRVVHTDAEFISSATAPLMKLVEDFLWLRFLENSQVFDLKEQRHEDDYLPVALSYPSGLTCAEIMMADLEALKLYFNLFRHKINNISKPLPQMYDPNKVSDYFSYRPHVLAFRIIEVLFAFLFAGTKLYISKRVEPNTSIAKKDINFDNSKYYVGKILKETLLYLGPTFIKVGQSLSTRPDIIGSEICEGLSELHDNVPPFETEIAMNIIELELGCNLNEKFKWISKDPVAAASFGQVYKGCTKEGTIVAIKVQRPDLFHYVARDIYILHIGLALLRKIAKRRNNISLYADEVGKGLIGELDYTLEASNTSKFQEAHSKYSFMLVPKVIKELTTKRILTTEWINGKSPSELLSLSKEFGTDLKAKSQLLDLVNKGVQASLVQLLDTGLLHADPHSGNLRYTPQGRLAFLDFGLICKMEKKHQLAMLSSIIHIVNGDWEGLIYDLTQMDMVPTGTNLRRVTLDLEDALGEVAFNEGLPDIKFSKVLAKVWSVALKYHFRMPPYFTLVLRSLASLEGLAVAADPNFKTFQAAYPYVVKKLIFDNSLATRNILFSAVLNRKKELQLKKVLLFLKLSSLRKSIILQKTCENSDEFETVSLDMKLLSSSEGVVIRRLLMTAEGTSLARSVLCEDALFFRQFIIKTLANAFYQYMIKIKNKQLNAETESLSLIQTTLTDRRLKVILFKIIKDLRKDPILMLKLIWAGFRVAFYSGAIAMHRFIVGLFEDYSVNVSFGPKGPKQVMGHV